VTVAAVADPGITPPPQDERNARANEAARQFEGIIVRELMKILRKTAPEGGLVGGSGGSGYAGEMYTQMMDDALSDQLTSAGGIGLAPTLASAFGSTDPHAAQLSTTGPISFSMPGLRSESYGVTGNGLTARVQYAAASLLDGGGAERFSREGQLLSNDLASDFETSTAAGDVARFNVRDANGFQGYYKCNLFAFELARRAGFDVPVVGRTRGWGYPVPNTVTEDASDGALSRGWARVATGRGATEIDGDLSAGRRGFMLTASADGRAGHMAMVERVHEIQYDDEGQVRRVVFDGWEARSEGAQHLTRRTWNLTGNPGGNLARNGFSRIEILELTPRSGAGNEIPLSNRAGSSDLDNSSQVRSGSDR
jgi:Rod binding domain-containing protein